MVYLIMNEESNWDQNVDGNRVVGAVDGISRDEVVQV